MRVLGGGEIAEQPPDLGIRAARRGRAIEPRRVLLHLAGALAHLIETERTGLPDRPALDEAAHVGAPDQRDVTAVFVDIQIDQRSPMTVLLLRHAAKDIGTVWKVVGEAMGEVGVDAAVLLFRADGDGQDFVLSEIVEAAHGA